MVRIYIKILLTLRNRNTPWGLNNFVPVCYCVCLKIPVQSVPISTPQTIGTSGSIGTAATALPRRPRFVQIYVANDLKLMVRNAGTDFLYPGDENQLFPMPKRNMARFANNDCCWHILLTTTNPQEMRCWNHLRGPVSHRFSSWIAVKIATAATNSLAAETDITSYRVHERPRWVWNKHERAHTPDAKKSGNI